jgi:catechol 2,3-dioxygenase-like lactoylglutathione lyase family enzyme
MTARASETAMPAARRLSFDHLALPARDAQATLDFYGGALGLPLVGAASGDDWDGHPWLMMMFGLSDGRQIAMCVLDGGPDLDDVAYTDDLPHFALSAPDDAALETWRKRLHEAGVDFREEDHGTQQSLYFSDPSGLAWEITSPASKTLAASKADASAVVADWMAARAKSSRL